MSNACRFRSVLNVAAAACALAPALSLGAPGDTELVSVGMSGTAAGGIGVDISGDGRYVLFLSRSSEIAPNDPNDSSDWYVRDRTTDRSTRVNLGNGGVVPNDPFLFEAALSDDGRYVAFDSPASNFVSGDTNDASDVFLRDLQTGVVERVSVGSNEQQANATSSGVAVSADGRYVAFSSWATNLGGSPITQTVYVRDRVTGQTTHDGSPSPRRCYQPKISGNGQVVGYTCQRTDFVYDATVRDRQTGAFENLNRAANGTLGNGSSFVCGISGDGRFVAFISESNLVADDTNPWADVFIRDREQETTRRVSVSFSGGQANGDAGNCDISADGRYVAFRSEASNLIATDTTQDSEVFVRDRTRGSTQRINVSNTGVPVSSHLDSPLPNAISADGQFVAFSTFGAGLVPNDTNVTVDAFVHQIVDEPPPPVDHRYTVKPQDGLKFGEVTVGTSKTLNLWLKNIGATPLPVWSVTVVGLNGNQYAANSTCVGTLVASGVSCAIRVTFVPASVGIKWARVRVVAGEDLLRVRQLSGTGVAP